MASSYVGVSSPLLPLPSLGLALCLAVEELVSLVVQYWSGCLRKECTKEAVLAGKPKNLVCGDLD